MKNRDFDNCVGAGHLRHEVRRTGAGSGATAVVQFAMIALAFIMIDATPAVVTSGAHAQSSSSLNGTPTSGLVPEGTPVEIVSGLDIP